MVIAEWQNISLFLWDQGATSTTSRILHSVLFLWKQWHLGQEDMKMAYKFQLASTANTDTINMLNTTQYNNKVKLFG